MKNFINRIATKFEKQIGESPSKSWAVFVIGMAIFIAFLLPVLNMMNCAGQYY